MIHFLKLLPHTGAFPFWLRLPSILADVGTVSLVTRLLPNLSRPALLLLVLNPISILISGFHGNTDPIMIFWVVAALYCFKKEWFWLAGIAFGMALNTKVVPFIMLPSFLFYLHNRRALSPSVIIFSLSVITTVTLFSFPYVLHPKAVMVNVWGYRGVGTNWGIAFYANLAGLRPDVLVKPLVYLILALAMALPWFLQKKRRSLFGVCATILFIFYFLTPSLGVQYLAWGVPFLAVLSVRWMVPYYLLGGGLIALEYHRWSGGHWVFADSHSVPPVTAETAFLAFVLWVCCGATLYVLLKTRNREFGTS
jgi:4-amino-4-deoxy-L-arabinose transferase-like glycosyltransferase